MRSLRNYSRVPRQVVRPATIALLGLFVAFIALDMHAPATASAANPTVCVESLSGSVEGDIVVPAGARCDLQEATVGGSIAVETEARLYVDHSQIDGSIRALGMVRLFFSEVKGNVRIEGTAAWADNGVCGSSIGGNLEFIGNAGSVRFGALGRTSCMTGDVIAGNVRIEGSNSRSIAVGLDERIGGNLEIVNNTTLFGIEVHYNRIDGHLRLVDNRSRISLAANQVGKHLQCEGNDPVPSGYSTAVKQEGQCTDQDGDRVYDAIDNCPDLANFGQRDSDGDGLGDACDSDLDNDGVVNSADNCPAVINPDQADWNGDGIGDACADRDQDGRLDPVDNCPDRWNPGQADLDGDGLGDECDPDLDPDGDGVPSVRDPRGGDPDNCPSIYNPDQWDTDRDQVGDACDPDYVPDWDEDGVGDPPGGTDNCPDWPNPDQADADGDAVGDGCDPDLVDWDQDGIVEAMDNCPGWHNPDQADSDGDGLGDACDPDIADLDWDGVVEAQDNCPGWFNPDQADSNGDGVGDACEPSASVADRRASAA